MNTVVPGVAIPIEMSSYDDLSSLFPAVLVYETTTGAEVFLGRVNMHSVDGGTYIAYFTPGLNKSYLVRKVWYTDGTYTTVDQNRSPSSDSFYSYDMVSALWAALRSANVVSGSFGEALQGVITAARANNLDNLDAAVSATETAAAASASFTSLGTAVGNVQTTANTINSKIGTPAATVSADIAAVKSSADTAASASSAAAADTAQIKPQTDKLTFDGSNQIMAHTHVVDDKTGYALSTPAQAALVDAVWDENIPTDHQQPDSAGLLLSSAGSHTPPTSIAAAVWDALVSGHGIPNTFGDYVQVTRQFAASIASDIANGVYGLAAAKGNVDNKTATVINKITEAEGLINAIPGDITASQNTVMANVTDNKSRIIALASQVSSNLVQILNQFATTQDMIDTVDGHVLTLQNNTTSRFIVPPTMVIPASTPKNYQFELRLYDAEGAPTSPDSTPTVSLTRLDSGVPVVSNAPMSQHGTDVGSYFYQFVLGSGSPSYPAIAEARVVEAGVTRLVPATTEVTPFDNDLSEVINQLTQVQNTVTDIDTLAVDGTFGFAALRAAETMSQNMITSLSGLTQAVKNRTDNLPNSPASVADTTAVTDAVMTRPTLTQIQGLLNTLQSALAGPDARNLTQVYNVFDLTPVAKTNDPRFNRLDVNVSTRSTLAAIDVWTYVNRTLTSVHLPSSDIKAIWDYLASAAVPLSMGARIKDYLNAPIAPLPNLAQITALLAGIAQETTVAGLAPLITNGDVTIEGLINALALVTAAVKAKTDHLPSDPASAGTVAAEVAGVSTQVTNVAAQVTQVMNKTNFLPADPARQSAVLAIPTNPVRTDDVRIGYLDVPVSTRSTFSGNLSGLATHADVAGSTGAILGAVSDVSDDIDTLLLLTAQVKAKTDHLPASPVSLADLATSTTAILLAIDDIPTPSGLTAADVWTYSPRSLDVAPPPPDLSNLATHADVAAVNQYQNEMSTSFNEISGEQEIIAWAVKNGRRVTGADCTVAVKDANGTTVWADALASPNADGIFLFQQPVALSAGRDYYVVISITVDLVARVNQRPFMTVG